MKIIQEINQLPKESNLVLAMGFFDGVHRGHQDVLQRAKDLAQKKSAEPVVLTFDPHPLTLLAPHREISLLTSTEEKEKLLAEAGFSTLLRIRPTMEFLNEEAETFLCTLIAVPNLVGLVTGENFTFGKGAKGNTHLLRDYFQGTKVTVDILPLRRQNGIVISSTYIREKIMEGDVKTAGELLTRPFSTEGKIIHGHQRGGALLGYPTANLSYEKGYVLPQDGVYATSVTIDGQTYMGATSVGYNPTFGNHNRTIETFIISFEGEIYGETMTLRWLKKIREEKKFDTIEALKAQIKKDVEESIRINQEAVL